MNRRWSSYARVVLVVVLFLLGALVAQGQETGPTQADDLMGSWSLDVVRAKSYLPLAAASFGSHPSAAGVTPASWSATLAPGACGSYTEYVTTGPYAAKLDVLFLFDTTGSMSGELSTMKSYATSIMTQVRAVVPDSSFGVADFRDYVGSFNYCGYNNTYGYSGDYPWKLHLGINSNVASVQAAINGVGLGNGADGPESYARALYETLYGGVGWRTGAEHTVVLMGDAPAHDCTFYTTYGCSSTGRDPGRDATVGTSDDLSVTGVISLLKTYNIGVISIYSTSESCVEKGFQYYSSQTGAGSYKYGSVSDIPGAVKNEIIKVAANTAVLTLKPTSYASWVTWTPSSYTNVPPNTTKAFSVKVCVPTGTAGGTYTIPVHGLADGVSLGYTNVKITVPGTGCRLPLRIELKWSKANDLDAHFWLPKSSPYEVYFVDQGSPGIFPWAELDVDDLDGYGPENIRINKLMPGTSRYAVHRYSGTPTLRNSSAVVRLYDATGLKQTWTVPRTNDADWWDVFTIDQNCKVTTVNVLRSYNPGPYGIGPEGVLDPVEVMPEK